MQEALYGPGGFYVRGERPAAHFRTSVHTSARYAAAVLALLCEVDVALGQPAQLDLVDIGAGQGELLSQVLAAAGPPLAGRIVPHAAEVAPRPPGLDPRIRWAPAPPPAITGLVIASEWLDNVPLDAAELGPDGPRLVLVDTTTGAERSGPAVGPADLAWLRRWWPLRHLGDRAEVGRPRCAAWAGVIGRLDRGVALAADYGHRRASAGRRDAGGLPRRPGGAPDPGRLPGHHRACGRGRVCRGRRGGRGDRDPAHHPAGGPARARADRAAARVAPGGPRSGRLSGRAGPGGRGGRADRPGWAGRVQLAGPGGWRAGARVAGPGWTGHQLAFGRKGLELRR